MANKFQMALFFFSTNLTSLLLTHLGIKAFCVNAVDLILVSSIINLKAESEEATALESHAN